MKTICVVTGTRAEYGLLRWVIDRIQSSEILELQLVVTGMHLSPEFGMTAEAIQADGFKINKRVEMLMSSDSSVGISKSMGLAMIGFADAFAELNPDLLLVLGDRFEIFSAVSAAMIARIPIAHIHGGEITEGAFDDAIRHSITKMSHLHFVATEEYRNRVIQLGECPDRVNCVGGLGVDVIKRTQLLGKKELQSDIDFEFKTRNLLVTFNPVTLEKNTSASHIDELLLALGSLAGTGLIFTMPNADTDGRIVMQKIKEFCDKNTHAKVFESLGQQRYLSCIQHTDGVVGNSSSGLLEAPALNTGTINIGDRQKGRLKASSVIDCKPERDEIRRAIDQLFSDNFQSSLKMIENPYGHGGATERICEILEKKPLHNILKKSFFDTPITLKNR